MTLHIFTFGWQLLSFRTSLLTFFTFVLKINRQVIHHPNRFSLHHTRLPLGHRPHHTDCLLSTPTSYIPQQSDIAHRSILFNNKRDIHPSLYALLFGYLWILDIFGKIFHHSFHPTREFWVYLYYLIPCSIRLLCRGVTPQTIYRQKAHGDTHHRNRLLFHVCYFF